MILKAVCNETMLTAEKIPPRAELGKLVDNMFTLYTRKTQCIHTLYFLVLEGTGKISHKNYNGCCVSPACVLSQNRGKHLNLML